MATKRLPKLAIDVKRLKSDSAREKALDTLGAWFVDAVAATVEDEATCREVLATAITTFFDIRESADQARGEYAGHFFLVDAVGLDDSERPVPAIELAKRITPAHQKKVLAWFEKAERSASQPPVKKAKPPKQTKQVALELTLVPTGRVPPPLPPAEGEHAGLLEPLIALEQAFVKDSKSALVLRDKALAAIAAGKAPWAFSPAQAAALAESLGLDLGFSPGNPDRTLLKTRAEWKKQDSQFERLGHVLFARGAVWHVLLALIARDAKLRAVWKSKVAALDDVWWKNFLSQVVS